MRTPRGLPVIGVDPGLTGALCLLHDGIDVADMPVCDGRVNAHALAELVIGWGPIAVAAVEHVHSFPGQGVASTFRFGQAYGVVLGVLAALERPIVHVTPTVWTKAHGLTSDKDGHRRRAIETWPQYAGLFARRKDDGRADAALIAQWAAWQQASRAA